MAYLGKAQPNRQQYDCDYSTFEDLMTKMPQTSNPVKKWNKASLPTASDVTSWFRNDGHVAFYGPPNGSSSPLTYAKLQEEIQGFDGYSTESENGIFVVAVLLPPSYMAETAVTLMTLLAQQQRDGICVTPVDPNMPTPKICQAFAQLQCTALVTSPDLYDKFLNERDLAASMEKLSDIRLIKPCATKDIVGVVEWSVIKHEPLVEAKFQLNLKETDRPSLLLRTSGTTSTPKIVPITAGALLYNATCLAASLQLDPAKDVGCNVMPLFHIGGISCGLLTVLVSGSSIVMVPGPFESNTFLDAIETNTKSRGMYIQPTWYYGVPSMHKALILTAKSRKHKFNGKNNKLRFIRSGAAHLPHETAVELAQVFQTTVMPTYSMSECMPVCSCHDAPIAALSDGEIPREGVPKDTVGVPIGSSLAIVDQDGNILPYGQIGEVSLKGPGVINAYIGQAKSESHTTDGWFRTGDMGQLDINGRVVLSGRTKEMIKRGGEQVWPNEVDSAVETVNGVQLAVTFGVPNELWGEEVHVAVVLDSAVADTSDKNTLEKSIVEACAEALGVASAPSKIHFVPSPAALLKGSTGKYLRTRMAEHLGAKPVDTGALNALEAMANMTDGEEKKVPPTPSISLNGVRFLAACFVVQHHVGLFPNAAWLRIQTFSLNMTVFFLLGGFQLTMSIKNEVKSNSVQWVGTKIGSMHALFLVAQVLAFASYVLFQCGEKGYTKVFDQESCAGTIPYTSFILNLLTGVVGPFDPVNGPAWFQSAFYLFLVFYPALDKHLRQCSKYYKIFVFWLNLFIATVGMAVVFSFGGFGLNFFIVSWLPALVTAMIAGYWFNDYGSVEDNLQLEEGQRRTIFQRPRMWGIITDVMSLLFFLIEVAVALDGGNVPVWLDNYEEMRPNETYTGATIEFDGRTYGYVNDLTYDEFIEYVHSEPDDMNMGRWATDFGSLLGFLRLGTPLVLLWLFGLAYGRGATAWFMKTQVMQVLAPYAYPLYLLHVPVCRFYWVATRGYEAEHWWPYGSAFPFPVDWYEVFIIIAICLALSVVLDRFVVQYLSHYTVSWGVKVCRVLSKCCCCLFEEHSSAVGDNTNSEVTGLVQSLTGNPDVDRDTKLQDLGLDSLGATALLGTLKACVPSAGSLTLAQLSSCDTVGDLVDLLEENQEGPSPKSDSKESEKTHKAEGTKTSHEEEIVQDIPA